MAIPDPTASDESLVARCRVAGDRRPSRRSSSRAPTAACSTAARALQADSAPGRIEVRDLYALYPDYLVDVPLEQSLLARRGSSSGSSRSTGTACRRCLKLWLDDVLTFGWAYGPGGTALRGKDLWLVASTGGPEDSYRPDSYNRYFFDAFMPPYEQTAALCGMRFLPPLILHGAHQGEPGRARGARADLRPTARRLSELAGDRRRSRTASPARCRASARPVDKVMEAA